MNQLFYFLPKHDIEIKFESNFSFTQFVVLFHVCHEGLPQYRRNIA